MIHRLVIRLGGREHEIEVEPVRGRRWRLSVGGRETVVDAQALGNGSWSVLSDAGWAVLLDVEEAGGEWIVEARHGRLRARVEDARRLAAMRAAPSSTTSGGAARLRAPMPGKIVRMLVAQGEQVAAGQSVIVMEAMKMENEMRAPATGNVIEISVEEGATVEAGQILMVIGGTPATPPLPQ